MKKFILAVISVLFISISASYAQTIVYRTTEFASGQRNYRHVIVWGNWQRSNLQLTIDWDRSIIRVYSQLPQEYQIYDVGQKYRDLDKGESIDCKAIDYDGLKCAIRLRVQDNGTSQLYVFYEDCAWVYNLIIDRR